MQTIILFDFELLFTNIFVEYCLYHNTYPKWSPF